MDKNRITTNQIALLLLLVLSGGKFLILPSIISSQVGHDSWIVMTLCFAYDAIGLTFLLWAVKLNKKSLDLQTILQKSLSKVGAKVVLLIFFVMFITRSIVLLNSCYKMFAVTFDVNTNWVLFVIPVACVAFFAVHRGFNSIARFAQLVIVLIVICVLALLIFPFAQVDAKGLLPIAEAGWGNIFTQTLRCSFWFTDYVFVYFVLENITKQKVFFGTVLASFALSATIAVAMNIVFVLLYGSLAPEAKLAMIKIGLFSISESTSGRWDWLTLSVWIMSVLLKVVVFIFCAYRAIEKLLDKNFSNTNCACMLFITAMLMLPLFVSVDDFLQYVVSFCTIPFCLVQYALPLVMPLFARRANKLVVKYQKEISP